MKVLLNYSILALLAICLNMEIAGVCDVYTNELSITSEQQFVAYESQTTQKAINAFYTYCSNMPCDIVCYASKEVPTDKFVWLDTHLFGKTNSKQDTSKKKRTQITLHYSTAPNTYYVFGLRKIVV